MDWLKNIRLLSRMTQEEVAQAVCISQPSYANIETGRRMPSVSTAKRIAAVLGFEWQRFYDDPEFESSKESPA